MVNALNLVSLIILPILGLGLLARGQTTEGCIFIAAALVVVGLMK